MEKVKKKPKRHKVTGLNKSTKAQFEERVGIVTEMLLSGLKRKDILQNISNVETLKWKVTVRQIDNYIEEATKVITTSLEVDRKVLVNKVYSRFDFLYKKMVLDKDYRGAAAVNKDMCMFINTNELIPVLYEDAEIRQPVVVNITGRPQMHHYEETIDSQEVTVIANQRLIS